MKTDRGCCSSPCLSADVKEKHQLTIFCAVYKIEEAENIKEMPCTAISGQEWMKLQFGSFYVRERGRDLC